ncbi:MAG: biotin transporter BioY [Ruminiclostridium sp.]
MSEVTASKRKISVLSLTLAALFTALVAVGAFIQIPVPYMDYFTLQFLFVVLSGMMLGAKLGAVSVAVYVLIGLCGVPIFAAGGGIAYVVRPSFGYLLGFIAASFVVGFICKKLKANKYWHYLLAALGGFVVTYAIGLLYKYLMLNLYVGEPTPFWLVLASCFPLDMPGDLLLCALAAFLGQRLQKIRKRYIKVEY